MKPGDTVVCIDNKTDVREFLKLTVNKQYTILPGGTNIWIRILNDDNEVVSYPITKFITLQRYREQQLAKLSI